MEEERMERTYGAAQRLLFGASHGDANNKTLSS